MEQDEIQINSKRVPLESLSQRFGRLARKVQSELEKVQTPEILLKEVSFRQSLDDGKIRASVKLETRLFIEE